MQEKQVEHSFIVFLNAFHLSASPFSFVSHRQTSSTSAKNRHIMATDEEIPRGSIDLEEDANPIPEDHVEAEVGDGGENEEDEREGDENFRADEPVENQHEELHNQGDDQHDEQEVQVEAALDKGTDAEYQRSDIDLDRQPQADEGEGGEEPEQVDGKHGEPQEEERQDYESRRDEPVEPEGGEDAKDQGDGEDTYGGDYTGDDGGDRDGGMDLEIEMKAEDNIGDDEVARAAEAEAEAATRDLNRERDDREDRGDREEREGMDEEDHTNRPPHGSEVFIGGLPREFDEDGLKEFFSTAGEIFEARKKHAYRCLVSMEAYRGSC